MKLPVLLNFARPAQLLLQKRDSPWLEAALIDVSAAARCPAGRFVVAAPFGCGFRFRRQHSAASLGLERFARAEAVACRQSLPVGGVRSRRRIVKSCEGQAALGVAVLAIRAGVLDHALSDLRSAHTRNTWLAQTIFEFVRGSQTPHHQVRHSLDPGSRAHPDQIAPTEALRRGVGLKYRAARIRARVSALPARPQVRGVGNRLRRAQ
eukprot:6174391-Pleurochrysis_carterae.AAC.2